MQAKDLKIGDKFKLVGHGKWGREMEVLKTSIEEKMNKTRIIIDLTDGKIKLQLKQEVQLIINQ